MAAPVALANWAALPGAAQQPLPPPPSVPSPRPVCVACGGLLMKTRDAVRTGNKHWQNPILIHGTKHFRKWQLDGKERQKQGRMSKRLTAQDDEQLVAQIPGPETRLDFFESTGHFAEIVQVGGEWRTRYHRIDSTETSIKIPIHPACLTVAKEYVVYQNMSCHDFYSPHIGKKGGEPSALAHLYSIWSQRAIATNPKGLVRGPILEPRKYFIPAEPSLRFMVVLNTCPVNIPSLTCTIVTHLRPLPADYEEVPNPELVELFARFENSAPQEIADLILVHLDPFEDELMECTRILPPAWWRDKLLHGRLIPWLWDLKSEHVAKYLAAHEKNYQTYKDAFPVLSNFEVDCKWDWELLVRRLSQGSLDGNCSPHKGPEVFARQATWDGIENRQRIWKLLKASRLGHVMGLRLEALTI